jgi:DHA1 family inner membrane transport protein
MATEGGWDVGCCAACLTAAALAAAHVSLAVAILLALTGSALGLRLLLHSYGALMQNAPARR